MRNKATHVGECQVCGRTQKLPGGKLAQHGYTVYWGCFDGTCNGSDELPFEQDKFLVDKAIADATVYREDLVKTIKELREDTNPAKARVQFQKVRYGDYESAWVDTNTITKADSLQGAGHWVAPIIRYDGLRSLQYEAVLGNYRAIPTATQAAYLCNVEHADRLEGNSLYDITKYIEWQKRRIQDWAVRPLREIAIAK